MFWDKVKMAYTRWYKNANPDSYKEFGLKGFTTEMRTGLPFLIAQMKKSTDLEIKYVQQWLYSSTRGLVELMPKFRDPSKDKMKSPAVLKEQYPGLKFVC